MKDLNDIIAFRLEKNQEDFEASQILASTGHWDAVMNRLYYAAYHSVSALLYRDGAKAKSHSGLKNKFHELYMKTGKMPIALGETYDELFVNRHEADYADFVVFSEDESRELIERTKTLLAEIRKYIIP